MNTSTVDILIIGAGQAGLALAWHLRNGDLSYRIVERNQRIGDSWRKRYDSLTLFTPRSFSLLPRLALSGHPDGYATRDEFADYLETYAQHFAIPVQLGVGVRQLTPDKLGFRAELDSGESIQSRAVVIATGAFQRPSVPVWANQLNACVQQFTPETYRNPAQISGQQVLVIGDGATGRDIALELAEAHTVMLAAGHPRRLMPERLFGISMWWWLDKLGVLRISGDSFIGRKLREMDSFPARGNRLHNLQAKGIHLLPKAVSATGNTVYFADGQTAEFDAVVWATGYRDDSDWLVIPDAKDTAGSFIHRAGVSPVPHLYFIGRPWQRNRASAIIAGVGGDAGLLKERIRLDLNANRLSTANSLAQAQLHPKHEG